MSNKNQLFKELPSKDLVLEVLKTFGPKSFKDNVKITLKSILNNKTLDNIQKYNENLRECYVNCKAKIYLDNLNEKKAVTVLRQLLKIHGHTLQSKERYTNGKKYLEYNVIALKKQRVKGTTIKISFD